MPSKKCCEIKFALPDFATGHVDDSMRKEIEGHVISCIDCLMELEDIRKTLSLVQEEVVWKPSGEYWANFLLRVNAKLETRKSRLQVPAWVNKFAIPFATAIVAVIIISRIELTGVSTHSELKEIIAGASEGEIEQIVNTFAASSTVSDPVIHRIEVSNIDDRIVAKLTHAVLAEEIESDTTLPTVSIYGDESALNLEAISDQDFEKVLEQLQAINM